MPVTIAADIIDTARKVYLNDPNAREATDDILLPFLKEAYRFLEGELEANSVQCKSSEVIATIPANTDEYYPLPSDLVIPTVMHERMINSADEFRPISYRMNLPQVTPTTCLEFWTYRLDRIYFVKATQAREILLYYKQSFPAVDSKSSTLFGKAETYLAAKTAALYNLFVRQSTTLAEVCNQIAESELATTVNEYVKLSQSQVVRRKGYIPFASS